MKYDVSGHELLSDEANALDPITFESLNEIAEDLLGLTELDLIENDDSGSWADRLKRYVALQINHQVASLPEAFQQTSSGVGPLSTGYRSDKNGEMFTRHSIAVQGIALVMKDYLLKHAWLSRETVQGWKVLTSRRL